VELIQRAQRSGCWGSKNSIYFTEKEHQTRFFVSFSSMEKEKIVRWRSQSFSMNAIQQFKIQHIYRQPKITDEQAAFLAIRLANDV